MLGLQGSEQGLLGAQYLHGTRWLLGQIHQTASVTDQSSPDEFADKSRQIWSDGAHTISQVFRELRTVCGYRYYLFT
jgi:hypothetical protein